jgi:pimeloyl-ACP methyl ester carboxylesterase
MIGRLLFLSGAGLPAWIWDDVRSGLEAETRVADHPRGVASLADYAAAALAAAEGWDTFGIVAHSLGGAVGSELVAQAPGRVSGFLGVAAVIPAPDRSFVNSLPFPQRYVLGPLMRLTGTKPPESALRKGLGSGLPAEQADRVVAEFEPESLRVYRDPVSPRTFPRARAYVVTDRDREFSESLQEKYAAELDAPIHRVNTAHLPMLEDPHALAALVSDLALSP